MIVDIYVQSKRNVNIKDIGNNGKKKNYPFDFSESIFALFDWVREASDYFSFHIDRTKP